MSITDSHNHSHGRGRGRGRGRDEAVAERSDSDRRSRSPDGRADGHNGGRTDSASAYPKDRENWHDGCDDLSDREDDTGTARLTGRVHSEKELEKELMSVRVLAELKATFDRFAVEAAMTAPEVSNHTRSILTNTL